MLEKLKNKLRQWFNPEPLDLVAPIPTTARKPAPDAPGWWRNKALTPTMSHRLRNDKGLMYAENTLLQNLILRHFKEVS